MKKKIAITGGAGFIGAYLVRKFVSLDYDVVAIDNFMRGTPERLSSIEGQFEMATVDICDKEQLVNATKGCAAIFHLAAINGTENFYKIPDKILEVGVKGVMNIMDACYENGIKELVIASSAEAYQDPETIPTPESVILKVPDPSNPRYSYGASKLISEVIAFNYYRDHFTKLQIFRPHNIYGPDMGTKHVIPQFVLRLLDLLKDAGTKNEPINFDIQGDGLETRAFCYIDDLVDALVTMYLKGGHREIYHLGNPEEVSILEVVDAVFANTDHPYKIVEQPLTTGSVKRRCPSIDKIKALGYEPKVMLKEGVKKTYDWYSVHHLQNTNNLI
jgi:UDP-glucose 4-epimerase